MERVERSANCDFGVALLSGRILSRRPAIKATLLAPLLWIGFMGVFGLNLHLTWGQTAVPTALMAPAFIVGLWAFEHGYFYGTDSHPYLRSLLVVPSWITAIGALLYVFSLTPA